MKRLNCNLVIDFDSTFVKLEGLEELAKIALENHPAKEELIEKIGRITEAGMEGKITFSQSLSRRLKILPANRKQLEELVFKLKENVTESVKRNRAFFENNNHRIYIISGGFEDFVWPVVEGYGLKKENVLANSFVYDEKGNIMGADEKNVLTQDGGKTKAVAQLKLIGETVVVGDGYTDCQIKKEGVAEKFCAFCENVRRASVIKEADCVIDSFEQLPEEFFIKD